MSEVGGANIQKLDNMLLVTVPRDLLDEDVLLLRRLVAQNLRVYRATWVLLDFSAVDICDSFFGRFIQTLAHVAKLMGAEVIISGLQDAVIETLVDLGLPMPGVHAVLDLDDAVELSRTRAGRRGLVEEIEDDFSPDADEAPGLPPDSTGVEDAIGP